MRRFKTLLNWGVFGLIMVCVVSITVSLMAPPREQCDSCGKLMVAGETVEFPGGQRTEYLCPCGMHGTLAVQENGRERWWEWAAE